MRIRLLALLALAACQPQTVTPVWQYRWADDRPPLPLSYARGAIEPSAAEGRRLRELAAILPQTVVPVFYDGGPLAASRAIAIERRLDRPVRLAGLPGLGPDQALLATPMPDAIVSDACRGPGERSLGDNWPGDDASAPALLPPGCAVETDLAAQVTEARDLLRGRPLPPGAALPYAASIERYYETFGEPAPADEGVATAGSVDRATFPPQSAGAAIGAQTNPLIGPLSPSAR